MTPIQFAIVIGLASLLAWVPFALIGAKARKAAGSAGSSNQLEVRAVSDVTDVGRRKFLLRGVGFASLAFLGQFALASIDFLYPRLRGGFGSRISIGSESDLRAEISATREPVFIPDGRFYLSIYEGDAEEAAEIPAYRSANVDGAGLMALYRKCVHLGCSVPWCPPAKWFECPCHGSKYSINGEYRDGPAPRGLDLFRVEIENGEVFVDTATIIAGAPRGTVTTQPQPEGAHCVTGV
ncbi:MAG TPA: Rieske 2Fe-2S domain-containing protein [Actinomycetota bacterium]|jgi:cytochrome b6-f complex iron-sulfur subunit|nr:Rieske 2Fe-2S domain-containing protein [Actinomycetota bacterium]